MSPVSVLVSKKDQRIYVRQGLAPVFDAPASVRDPETPLGTHVYIATRVERRWGVAQMVGRVDAGSGRRTAERARKENGVGRGNSRGSRAPTRPPASSPAEALERIEIAGDVRERISELLWTGGSLIVSDQPLSDETSDVGTDLVVKAR